MRRLALSVVVVFGALGGRSVQCVRSDPIVPGFTVQSYASVIDPIGLAFDTNGVLYVGRDNTGSGGGNLDAVRIHRVNTNGVVSEWGVVAIKDPDAVVVDIMGSVSGIPGTVLIGGACTGSESCVTAISPDQAVSTLFTIDGFTNIADLAFDSLGQLYVLGFRPARVMVSMGETPALLFGQDGIGRGLAVDSQNRIFSGTGSGDTGGIIRIHARDGNTVDDEFLAGLAQFRGNFTYSSGDTFRTGLVGVNDGTLLRYNLAGVPMVLGVGFPQITDTVIGPDGALYLSDFSNDQILRVAPLAGPVLTSIDHGDFHSPATWDDAPRTPEEDSDVVVAGHTVAVQRPTNVNSLAIREDGAVIVTSDSVLAITDSMEIVQSVLQIAPTGIATVGGDVAIMDGTQYVTELGRAATGRVDVTGEILLLNGPTLQFECSGASPFKAGTYTLLAADSITGTFAPATGLGRYVSDGPNLNGLDYGDKTLTVTIDWDLNQGDANLNGKTDVQDFNLWNASKFQSDTDWGRGDFDGNGVTDVRDFNLWNGAKFTTAWDSAPTEGQVPEPEVLVLLAGGLLGLVVCGLRSTSWLVKATTS